jgi:hypothetical protein
MAAARDTQHWRLTDEESAMSFKHMTKHLTDKMFGLELLAVLQ